MYQGLSTRVRFCVLITVRFDAQFECKPDRGAILIPSAYTFQRKSTENLIVGQLGSKSYTKLYAKSYRKSYV
jgi:hypothetical protein